MIRGQYEEHDKIIAPAHAGAMARRLEGAVDEWFARYAEEAHVGPARYKPGLRGVPSTTAMSPRDRVRMRLAESLRDYKRSRDNSYDALLDQEALDEYARDTNQFVRDFLKGIPILNKARNAPYEDLEPWKRRLHVACKADSRAIFQVIQRLVAFAADFRRLHTWESIAAVADPASLPLGPVEIRREDLEDDAPRRGASRVAAGMNVRGAIGLGITTALLHYREPEFLAWRSRFAMSGLHFLAGDYTGGLESSEFILWDVSSGGCHANYTYPYRLFMFHVARVANRLEAATEALGVEFPRAHRMVAVDDFLHFVADANAATMKSWMPGEEA